MAGKSGRSAHSLEHEGNVRGELVKQARRRAGIPVPERRGVSEKPSRAVAARRLQGRQDQACCRIPEVRHTYASQLAQAGVDPEPLDLLLVVAEEPHHSLAAIAERVRGVLSRRPPALALRELPHVGV